MIDPIEGLFGRLDLAIWMGEIPDGTFSAYLLLTTADLRAPETMPGFALAHGLNPRGGSVTDPVDPNTTWAEVAPDQWITVVHGPSGARYTWPAGEIADLAAEQGRAILVVGFEPNDGTDTYGYVETYGSRVSLGIIAVRRTTREDIR